MYTLKYMYYNYYNRKENNVVLSIQTANGRVFIFAQMGYYIFSQMGYKLSILCPFNFALLFCQFAQMSFVATSIAVIMIFTFIDWRFKISTEETFVRNTIKLKKFTILFKCRV